MKTKNIRLAKITVLFLFLSLAFNNCGQRGNIELKKENSTTNASESPISGPTPSDPETLPSPSATIPVVVPPAASPPPATVAPPATVSPPVLTPPPVVVTPPVVLPPAVLPPPVVTPPIPKSYEKKSMSLNVSAPERVDILFVVDNSVSMKFEQENMAKRVSTFINSINGLDWQMGIVTTDVDDPYSLTSDGKLLKFNSLNTYILNSKMEKNAVELAFGETIQRTEKGSIYEQGIYATYRFLERDLKRTSKLLRVDSTFNVIVISDADESPWEDDSGKPVINKKNKPKELMKYLAANWGAKKFQFHSIIVKDGDNNCLSLNNNENYGKVYSFLSNITKGIIGSVCENDYGSQLNSIGEKVNDLVKVVKLECEPKDTDDDGILDIEISSDSTKTIEIDRVVGSDVYLKKALDVGDYGVQYYCQKD